MKKILYVAHENTKGGATHSLINILDKLPSNIEPYVLIPKTLNVGSLVSKEKRKIIKSDTLKQELIKRNIRYFQAYYFLDNLKIKQNIFKHFFFKLVRKLELGKIAKKIKMEKISIIHSNSSVIKFGKDLSDICNLKHVWHIREDVNALFRMNEKGRSFYYKNVVNESGTVVFVSKKLKESFISSTKSVLVDIKRNLENFIVIYNGIPLIESSQFKKTLYKVSPLTIYCFGTLYDIKGQEDLIHLARVLIKHNIKDFSINLVGAKDNQYYEHLLNLIQIYNLEKKINFIDYTDKIQSLREDASLEVVCSRSEAFGRVAVEAMNFGNPLIVTNVGGLKEIVEHGKNGFKYEPGDINELYNIVKVILDNEVDIEEIVENGKNRSKEFDIRKCVEEIYKLY